MKKQIHKSKFIFVFILLFTACNKGEIIHFDNKNDALNFTSPETMFSFMATPDKEKDTVFISVNVMGLTVAYDRIFKVEIISARTNAPEKSYNILKGEVKAMEMVGILKIEIYNREDLANNFDTLTIRLLPSSDFQSGIQTMNTHTLIWTQKIIRPASWYAMYRTFSSIYSEECYRRIIEFTGLIEMNLGYSIIGFDSSLYPLLGFSERLAYQELFRRKVKEYNETHPSKPLRHGPDGVIFTFGQGVYISGIKSYHPNELIIPK